MGIVPVVFKKISVQQYPRKKYLWFMGKFPSHDSHQIVGKFTEDTGDTAQLLMDAAHLAEKFLNYMKFVFKFKKLEFPHMVR
jgi:hypothetical protein